MAKLHRKMTSNPSEKMISDVRRYKEKERKALIKDIEYIVGRQSIFVKRGQKTVRIRLRALIEYEFQYQDEEGEGAIVMGSGSDEDDGPIEDGAVEVSQEEIMKILAEHLDLIDLLELLEDARGESGKYVPIGQSKTGTNARLNRRATIKQKIARTIVAGKDSGFQESDKRFRFLTEVPDKDKKLIFYVVQDVSGSMSREERFIIRCAYSILIHAHRKRYKSVDIIFISHEEKAREEKEDEFFTNSKVGGTKISSGPLKVLEIQKARYGSDNCDVFFWHATDGLNEENDNPALIAALEQVCKITRLACLCVVGKISATVKNIFGLSEMKVLEDKFPHFVLSQISDKNQIKSLITECFKRGVKK